VIIFEGTKVCKGQGRGQQAASNKQQATSRQAKKDKWAKWRKE
jgi:hypothetical protein